MPNENPDPSAAATPHQEESTRLATAGKSVTSGMPVQTRSGESLGTVVDIVAGPTGGTESSYIVIADSGGSTIPVPYSTVSSMVQNGKVVIDRSRLESAPKVQQSQLGDRANRSWQQKADSYWSHEGSTRSGADRMRSSGEEQRDDMRSQQPDRSMSPDEATTPSR